MGLISHIVISEVNRAYREKKSGGGRRLTVRHGL